MLGTRDPNISTTSLRPTRFVQRGLRLFLWKRITGQSSLNFPRLFRYLHTLLLGCPTFGATGTSNYPRGYGHYVLMTILFCRTMSNAFIQISFMNKLHRISRF